MTQDSDDRELLCGYGRYNIVCCMRSKLEKKKSEKTEVLKEILF